MNAVNLIPGDSRSGGPSRSTSRQTLALLAGLAMVLIAAVLYVSAANGVTASKGELARATANAASWRTVATEFAPYVTASQQRTAQLAAVRQLAAGRFRWSHLLDQIAQLMPPAAELSSLQASTPAGSSATATATSTSTQPGIQLAGCAASQSTVAQAMQQLRHVDGVSGVTLSSSTDNGTGAAATGSASSATTTSGGGGCTYPVQFQISLTFVAGSTGAAAATSTNATAATSTTAAAQ
jgi:Tfp pilus assembly protein PilN